ncbi:pyruvate ferredoxin oxidoreductase [Candidatus Micrarchaeota archaeon]|nr:pyruvate ferredoxin oxidoreductase [Candidatus Micrarchaeota archaeon]
MKKTIEGSFAVAEVVRDCSPDVVACFPITPSTHIAEELDKMYANGEIKSYTAVESEFSAISMIVGASAAGARAFTTTDSQGLALMHEVIFAASGMRLPMVIVNANRSLSAPLSIWNDHQDSVSERDSGWIQLYCKNNQEVVDTVPQAFKISEDTNIPVMVCMDGFYLTHLVEQIDVPQRDMISGYLPPRKALYKLDPENPITMGMYALPATYQGFRIDLHEDVIASAKNIKEEMEAWAKVSGRSYGNGLWEEIGLSDAEVVFIGMGSVMENAELAIEKMRKDGKKAGILRIRCYRPFPSEAVKALAGKKAVVFEKALSMGADAPLYSELCTCAKEAGVDCELSSIIGGLGGKDVTVADIEAMLSEAEAGVVKKVWGD